MRAEFNLVVQIEAFKVYRGNIRDGAIQLYCKRENVPEYY